MRLATNELADSEATRCSAVVFDIDGTAVPHGLAGQPSERLSKAIRTGKRSMKICIATGRSWAYSYQVVNQLGVTDPCIVSAGARIVVPAEGDTLRKIDLAKASIGEVLAACRHYPYEVLVDDESVGEGAPAELRQIVEPVCVMYVMECSIADGSVISTKLGSIDGIAVASGLSWSGLGVDLHITHADATKERAVEWLLAYLDIDPVEAVGIGDGDNDLGMFRAVGKSIAMGNASELLKAHADEVCDSVDEDGLAKVLEGLAADSARY
jgi:hydroxymethylpyrimidine pyrophosphatase-like HAD family hydrolase